MKDESWWSAKESQLFNKSANGKDSGFSVAEEQNCSGEGERKKEEKIVKEGGARRQGPLAASGS